MSMIQCAKLSCMTGLSMRAVWCILLFVGYTEDWQGEQAACCTWCERES